MSFFIDLLSEIHIILNSLKVPPVCKCPELNVITGYIMSIIPELEVQKVLTPHSTNQEHLSQQRRVEFLFVE